MGLYGPVASPALGQGHQSPGKALLGPYGLAQAWIYVYCPLNKGLSEGPGQAWPGWPAWPGLARALKSPLISSTYSHI